MNPGLFTFAQEVENEMISGVRNVCRIGVGSSLRGKMWWPLATCGQLDLQAWDMLHECQLLAKGGSEEESQVQQLHRIQQLHQVVATLQEENGFEMFSDNKIPRHLLGWLALTAVAF